MTNLQSILENALAALPAPANVKEALAPYMSLESAVKALTPRGKGGKVKTNKPKDALWAYVWRMARFNNGDDCTLPVIAGWDLSSALDKMLPPVKYEWETQTYSVGSEEQRTTNAACERAVSELLDGVSMALVATIGQDPRRGSARWARALGY